MMDQNKIYPHGSFQVCENYDAMSEAAAEIIAEQLRRKPDSVLGFATGSTPIGMYHRLGQLCQAGKVDFSKATTYNLDEYYPMKGDHPQSYRRFMWENLFSHVNIREDAWHVPDGSALDADAACAAYEKAIEEAGGLDLQLLGVGNNGHIGFNEPAELLPAATHKVTLTESTIRANSRFFASEKDVPRHALTMGMGTILRARRILLLISGASKHEALCSLLTGNVTVQSPVSFLQLHNDVTVLCDREAYEG